MDLRPEAARDSKIRSPVLLFSGVESVPFSLSLPVFSGTPEQWSELLLQWSELLLQWSELLLQWSELLLQWSEHLLQWSLVLLVLSLDSERFLVGFFLVFL